MRITERTMRVIETARQWIKTISAIALSATLLTAALLVWTTRFNPFPAHTLYDYETEVQLALAALPGVIFAWFTYLALRRFSATLILAFIVAGILMATGLLVGAAVERLGNLTTLALMAFPLLAAVATKAANIASRKEWDTSVYRKFKESFEAALDARNFAELLLWTIAWAAGGFGVFLLIKAIEMW